MKKLTIEESVQLFADEVHKRFTHYEQRLKWHDEDIEEIKFNITSIYRLIILLFLENIAIILLLIIWSW